MIPGGTVPPAASAPCPRSLPSPSWPLPPSATGYLIVAAITLGARHTVIWSILGAAVMVASGNIDVFLPWSDYDTEALFSHDFWFVLGALFAMVIDLLLFYIIGLIVGIMRKRSWRRQREAGAAAATG